LIQEASNHSQDRQSDVKYTYIQIGVDEGYSFDLLNPDPSKIDIKSICHSLGQLNRFTGHTKIPVNIANHSLRVMHLVKKAGGTTSAIKTAIIHDMHEAFTNDISSPLKAALRTLAGYDIISGLESPIDNAIHAHLDFYPSKEDKEFVKMADVQALNIERELWMPPAPSVKWQLPDFSDIFGSTCPYQIPVGSVDADILYQETMHYFPALAQE